MALATLSTGLRALLVDRATAKDEGQLNGNEEEADDFEEKEDRGAVEDSGKASEEGKESHEPPALSTRPANVPDEDWIVYEAFQSVSTQFFEKWVKMWA